MSDLKTRGSRRVLHLSTPLVQLLGAHRLSQEGEARLRGDAWLKELNLIFTSTIRYTFGPGQLWSLRIKNRGEG